MKTLFLSATILLFSFTAQAQINCTKPGHVGELGLKLESTSTTRDAENVFVSVTTSQWICVKQGDQFMWAPHQALTTRQKTGIDGITFTHKVKKVVAYLATQNYKYFKTAELTNASIQTTNFQLALADVADDSKVGKLHFFLRTYGRVEFSDGRVIDPMVDNSRAHIVDITK